MSPLPVIIVAATVWCYWLSVLGMIVRSHVRHGASAGAVPRTGYERWLWLVWVPTVLAWQILPDMAYRTSLPVLRVPEWAADDPYSLLTWLAVAAALTAYVLTVPCWLRMGNNWSLAVVPGKATSLVTDGFYRRVRHPIYALGLVLMAASVAAAPAPAMFLLAGVHLTLVRLKARNEERFLAERHGDLYEEYCRRTGRFFPRLPTKTNDFKDTALSDPAERRRDAA
jgi:protein-S-isoprenylcysteine O-methyltransferase Ste14